MIDLTIFRIPAFIAAVILLPLEFFFGTPILTSIVFGSMLSIMGIMTLLGVLACAFGPNPRFTREPNWYAFAAEVGGYGALAAALYALGHDFIGGLTVVIIIGIFSILGILYTRVK